MEQLSGIASQSPIPTPIDSTMTLKGVAGFGISLTPSSALFITTGKKNTGAIYAVLE